MDYRNSPLKVILELFSRLLSYQYFRLLKNTSKPKESVIILTRDFIEKYFLPRSAMC